jgi:exodeoxyribonuclease V alpha subunit
LCHILVKLTAINVKHSAGNILLIKRKNEWCAIFRDEQGKMRKFLPVSLPRYETVWAMTVHKSQGSEFERVLLILSDHDINVITRELIYTGITRARKKVDI